MNDLPRVVFRCLTRRNDFNEARDKASADAFFRRPAPRDSDGLSVVREKGAETLRKVLGYAALDVSSIESLGLSVEPTPHDPLHFNIVGLPRREEDDRRAIYLANRLAEKSKLC